MGREKALSLVKESAAIGVCSLDLAGGDVLCYPHLFDVMEEMSKYEFLPFLLSTKCLLTREAASKLSNLKNLLLELQFSLDSDDGPIADFLVRSKGHAERMFQSIDNALSENLPVSVKAVITPYNIVTIPRFYRTLKERGVKKYIKRLMGTAVTIIQRINNGWNLKRRC